MQARSECLARPDTSRLGKGLATVEDTLNTDPGMRMNQRYAVHWQALSALATAHGCQEA
jgi:hypothetical protein